MMSRFMLRGGLGIWCWLLPAVLVPAGEAPGPVGSAFLTTVPVRNPSFGRLLYDRHLWDGGRVQRWRREQPEVDWLTVWIDLRTPGLGYRMTPVDSRAGPDDT